jgi:hypothetical protein
MYSKPNFPSLLLATLPKIHIKICLMSTTKLSAIYCIVQIYVHALPVPARRSLQNCNLFLQNVFFQRVAFKLVVLLKVNSIF